jgi:hypothetical protein
MLDIKRYTYDEYQKIARETSATDDLAILALGFIGECVEFIDCVDQIYDPHNEIGLADTINLVTKEAGDILWYAARIMDVLNVPFRKWQSYGNIDNYNNSCAASFRKKFRIIRNASKATEHVKKTVGHGHKLNPALICHGISNVIKDVVHILKKIHGPGKPGLDAPGMAMAMHVNVEKLRKRYPNGFETEKSVNREGVRCPKEAK